MQAGHLDMTRYCRCEYKGASVPNDTYSVLNDTYSYTSRTQMIWYLPIPQAGVWVSSADWFKAGVARQRAGPTSLGIAPPRVYDSE